MRSATITDPAFLGDLAVPAVPPTFVKDAGAHVNSASATATFPASGVATAGNILVAVVGCAAASPVTFNTPAGYAPLGGTASSASGDTRAAAFMKIAAGGETGVTATVTATSPFTNVELMEFTPGFLAIAQDAEIHSATGSALTSLATGSFGPFATTSDIVIVAAAVAANITGSEAITLGFTELSHLHRSGTVNILVAGYLIPAAATALNPTLSWAGSAVACALGVSIK